MRINDIIPYERNARHNEAAVPVVAESIKTFGFKGAIVLRSREDPTIVNGHTRVAACKMLGWEEFPDEYIVYADDLTDEQVRALRLADNRTGEVATWNKTLLQHEMKSIQSLDMSKFKFDFKSKQAGFSYGQERLKTDRAYNLHLVSRIDCASDGMPTLARADVCPDDLMGFNYAKTAAVEDKRRSGCHFFIDDYQFERIWTSPERYTEYLRDFDCVLGPDFSLYADMPLPMQIWNLYRSRALCHYWQREDIKVVPTLSWSQPETYPWAFQGMPKGGTVATSSVGVMGNESALAVWRDGMAAALRVIQPSRVLLYGSDVPDFDWRGVEVVHFGARKFKGV